MLVTRGKRIPEQNVAKAAACSVGHTTWSRNRCDAWESAPPPRPAPPRPRPRADCRPCCYNCNRRRRRAVLAKFLATCATCACQACEGSAPRQPAGLASRRSGGSSTRASRRARSSGSSRPTSRRAPCNRCCRGRRAAAHADTCVRPGTSCVLYVPEAQGRLPGAPHAVRTAVRVPASGVPYVPCTVWCTTGGGGCRVLHLGCGTSALGPLLAEQARARVRARIRARVRVSSP